MAAFAARTLALARAFSSARTAETIASASFKSWLASPTTQATLPATTTTLTGVDWNLMVKSSFATFLLHVKSRTASLEGNGFYTIGPCGEEFAACWGALLRDEDTACLHYRHVAAQIARQLVLGRSLDSILLDRSRGFVCSSLDPVTGGRHCAIGGVENIFYNTSTLASQAPAAVGRALATALLPSSNNKTSGNLLQPVHFVTLGDGSAHNAAFLTAKNLAETASFKRIKCPVLFCITDNDLSISYKQHGYMAAFAKTFQCKVFLCEDASDFEQVYLQSQAAFDYVRETQRPALLLLRKVLRRFGHAATDRQQAYLSQEEIDSFARDDALLQSVCRAAHASGQMTFAQMLGLFEEIDAKCDAAFASAILEPKLDTPEQVAQSNQAKFDTSGELVVKPLVSSSNGRQTMRKCMTTCLEEEMGSNADLVYLGEDVRHGGYYLVTEGLSKRFPTRVLDFPPDETNLIGCALGFAQRGLLPVVEIPYLKYLDCGADQFFEACLMHWITNGTPKQNGIIFRLQGFDRGKFGGNFHTHNALHLPPGLDVLCYSNGEDWAKGFRQAVRAARSGRMVALVDSTHALTKRHLFQEGDDLWLSTYPAAIASASKFEDIFLYPNTLHQQHEHPTLAIVTYGNGVPDALVVQKEFAALQVSIDVLDCPLLSQVPHTLERYLETHEQTSLLFADCCKLGQNPFALFIQQLQSSGHLHRKWGIVAAPRTYNPLGRTITFLSADLVRNGVKNLLLQQQAS